MREIVLDTETTGLHPSAGHRVIEIACVELFRHMPTGRIYHQYVNPRIRYMPKDAFEIHGLGAPFLARFPTFAETVDLFLEFVGHDQLIIHNAAFDLAFVNSELGMIGRPPMACPVVDTLAMARKQFPGAPASLDALCRKFAVDTSGRELHGAAIDCRLLAAVYLELLGGRSPGFELAFKPEDLAAVAPVRPYRAPRPHAPIATEETERFEALMSRINKPLWRGHDPRAAAVAIDDEIPF